MLTEGRRRLTDAGIGSNLSITQVDAENLPFAADHSFDIASRLRSGSGTSRDKEEALRSMYRVLKAGREAPDPGILTAGRGAASPPTIFTPSRCPARCSGNSSPATRTAIATWPSRFGMHPGPGNTHRHVDRTAGYEQVPIPQPLRAVSSRFTWVIKTCSRFPWTRSKPCCGPCDGHDQPADSAPRTPAQGSLCRSSTDAYPSHCRVPDTALARVPDG